MILLKDFVQTTTQDEMIKKIRDNFYQLRKNKKLSREKLALISGVNIGVIRRFEETYTITLKNLISLTFALDATEGLNELFKQKKEIKIYE